MHYHKSTKRTGRHKLIYAALWLFFTFSAGSIFPQENSVDLSPYGRAIKAFVRDPAHPGVSIDQFQGLARDLIKANKVGNLAPLAEIVTQLYPDSPGIIKGLGDMFYNLGQKNTALLYYKKALRLDRKLKDVRDRIKTLEKERKK
jgi:tetratricopeptide (TPR) repeat protein